MAAVKQRRKQAQRSLPSRPASKPTAKEAARKPPPAVKRLPAQMDAPAQLARTGERLGKKRATAVEARVKRARKTPAPPSNLPSTPMTKKADVVTSRAMGR